MAATKIYLIDSIDLTQVQLQFVPGELSFSPDSKIEAVVSPGRNNPFYHFSGSEDTLSFQIDWHAEQTDKEDVIRNCRWLESLTKADGYTGGQHPIKIIWGNLISKDTQWLVVAAGYKVSLFDRTSNMMPIQAYQDVILKRLSSFNRTQYDIRNNLDIDSSIKTGL